jgi:SOS response regulatory protein OraA/RecX
VTRRVADGKISKMSKMLVIVRNERSTYEVHIAHGNPPEKAVGGQHLDRQRLATELAQHGFPQVMIEKALQDVDDRGSTKLSM